MSKRLLILIFLLNTFSAHSIDFWQYPEMAEEHSIFLGGFFTTLSLPDSFSVSEWKGKFSFVLPGFYADYLLPVGLPFSLGFFIDTLGSGLTRYGIRPGYHINLNDENSDLYFLYTVDFVSREAEIPYTGSRVSLETGGRAGFRRRFGNFFCFTVESGFKFQTIYFGLSMKLN